MSLQREVIASSVGGAPASLAVRAGDFLFVSGLMAVDRVTGERRPGTTAAETRMILENLKALLEENGSSLEAVVKVNVLLHSMLEAPNMNDVYRRFFGDVPPARTVCGAKLPPGVKVMIECTAVV